MKEQAPPILLIFLPAFFVAPNGTYFNMPHLAHLEYEQKLGAKFFGINSFRVP